MAGVALVGCGSSSDAERSSATETTAQPRADEAPTEVEPKVAWLDAADELEGGGPSDDLVASNPAELADNSDWVLRATIGRPTSQRVFSTSAEPNVPVYSTVGFPLTNLEVVVDNSPVKLADQVVVEVVAPVGWEGPDDPLFAQLPAESSVLISGDVFNEPDRATTVATGTEPGVTYVAAAAQGFVVEVESGLLSIYDGTSDDLTRDLGLRTIDDVLAWLAEGPDASLPSGRP